MDTSQSGSNKKQDSVKDFNELNSVSYAKQHSITASNLSTTPNVKYNFKTDSKQWDHDNQCFLCERNFKMNLSRHHCRLCGKSCCGECSTKQVKKHRICDICFMKHTNQALEIQKKNYLRQMAQWTEKLEEKIEEGKKKILEKESLKEKLAGEIGDTNNNMLNRINEIEKNIDNLQYIYESKQKEKSNLEDTIKRRTQILEESENKVRDLESQIQFMDLNVNMQKQNYKMKLERKEGLKKHLEEMIKNEESMKQMDNDDPAKIDLVDDMIRLSAQVQQQDDSIRRTIENRG